MDFPDAIPIIVPCPFFLTMIDRGVGTDDMVVALRLIGVDDTLGLSETMDMRLQDGLSGIGHNPQPYLACFTSHCAHNRRTVIGISASPRPLIGPRTRRVSPVEVFVSFFPPRSETSRRFQSVHPRGACRVASKSHCLASRAAGLTRWCSASLTLEPGWWPVHLSAPHGSVRPLAEVSDGVVQTPSHCTGYRSVHTACTDRPSTGSCGWFETHKLGSLTSGSGDISTLLGENGPISTLGFGLDRVTL